MIREFREFLVKQNALALAVAVIIGAAIGKVVSSIVDDLINPVIGLALPGLYPARRVIFSRRSRVFKPKPGGLP